MASAATSFLQTAVYTPPEWTAPIKLVPRRRVQLGTLPTPVHRWQPPGVPEGVELWIKRDDMTGMQCSGNKVRKLEFLMADALEKRADSVVTIGGVQSNHCRATAVASRYLGLSPHLVLRTSRALVDSDPGLEGNLLLDRLVGAQLHMVTKEEYGRVGSDALGARVAASLSAAGRQPYVIPVGGSNALGTWGYLQAVEELRQQAAQLGLDFTDIVLACGSGGTGAGIALGNALSGLGARVLAAGVCDDPDYFYDCIDGLLNGLGVGPEQQQAGSRTLLQVVQARGEGYAVSMEEELRDVKAAGFSTGVVLDPVYSGKAWHCLRKLMAAGPGSWAGRRVLFWHTGGLLVRLHTCIQNGDDGCTWRAPVLVTDHTCLSRVGMQLRVRILAAAVQTRRCISVHG